MDKLQFPKKETELIFKEIFKTTLNNFKLMPIMLVTKRFSFDIIKFDEYCIQHLGYDEDKDGSLHNFLEKKYDRKTVKLIEYLINF